MLLAVDLLIFRFKTAIQLPFGFTLNPLKPPFPPTLWLPRSVAWPPNPVFFRLASAPLSGPRVASLKPGASAPGSSALQGCLLLTEIDAAYILAESSEMLCTTCLTHSECGRIPCA